jgi:hypothetical protein
MNRAQAPTPIPPLARWFFPSIKDVLFLGYLFGPSLLNESGVLYDSDTGWHIRHGETILRTWALPSSDYFSYTNYGKAWFSWEWLADVLMALIHKYAGLNGIAFWANATFALTFTLLFSWTANRGGNLLICLLFSRIAGFAAAVHWLARPHLFSMLLVLFWYMLLERIQRQGSTGAGRLGWTAWMLPLLMVVWTNLHGAFIIGVVLLLIYALGNFLSAVVRPEEPGKAQVMRLARHFFAIAILCLLASCVNPYGFKVHQHIFHSYLQSNTLVDRVTEFTSPNFHSFVVKFFEAILLASLVIAAASYRKFSFIDMGLLVFWTHMALFSVRHVPLYAIMLVPILVRHLTEYLHELQTDTRFHPRINALLEGFNRYSANLLSFENRFTSLVYPTIAILFMTGVCLNGGKFLGQTLTDAKFDSKQFPVKAADFVEKAGLGGNLFTTDYWGGYFIYRFHPRHQVFFDGRSDMYGEEFVKEYERVTNLDYRWREVLDKYKVTWILLPVDYGLCSALKERQDWRILYDDHQAIIFARGRSISPGN